MPYQKDEREYQEWLRKEGEDIMEFISMQKDRVTWSEEERKRWSDKITRLRDEIDEIAGESKEKIRSREREISSLLSGPNTAFLKELRSLLNTFYGLDLKELGDSHAEFELSTLSLSYPREWKLSITWAEGNRLPEPVLLDRPIFCGDCGAKLVNIPVERPPGTYEPTGRVGLYQYYRLVCPECGMTCFARSLKQLSESETDEK